ncbi:MAG TPA: DUF1501 domain-containing protein [Saprospiraceae bacterium]|nr:DUF1501 domain-containing protein [Saprospiraceae bacterium]
MLIKRRDFLKTGSLATASMFMPKFLKAVEGRNMLAPKGKVLVMLQMNGGNDGLNTVIPVRNDIYYKERKRIAVPRETSLSLGTEAGLHPVLSALKNAYDDGEMAVLNSVGYPNPDRSHFRSMDIWQSASAASEYWQTGWIGRFLDAQCAGRPSAALEIDDTLSLALKGTQSKGLALKDPKRLYESAHNQYFVDYSAAHTDQHEEAPVAYLYKTMAETLSSADYLFEQSRRKPASGNYPATGLGKQMKTIASLILADTDTSVYYVSLGSFDTHINQEAQQKRLFTEMNEALAAFIKEMKANGKWNDVLLATFSEFGRRVSQNASGGTDHGTANNMILLGGSLREKGLINPMPDLTDLDAGDLKYNIDFRQVYATLLDRWLDADAEKILGRKFDMLGFV